jgi:hypothetical protein
MNYSDSQNFFEISNGPYLDNSFRGRLLCVKDFLKRCAILPFALLAKAYKTFFRSVGVCFGAILVVITVGSSPMARTFFVERISSLARDLADWILLPIALFSWFVRLIMGLSFHPQFYFNSSF